MRIRRLAALLILLSQFGPRLSAQTRTPVREPALYLSVETLPMAAVVPSVHPQSSFANVRGQYSIAPGAPDAAGNIILTGYTLSSDLFTVDAPQPGWGGGTNVFVAKIKPGRVLFEVDGVDDATAREAMRLGAGKLRIATKFVGRSPV